LQTRSYSVPGKSDHTVATLDALKKIGATNTHKLFQRVCRMYPGGQPSTDPILRLQQGTQVLKAFGDTFKKMNVQDGVIRLDDWEEDLFKLLLQYWDEHQ